MRKQSQKISRIFQLPAKRKMFFLLLASVLFCALSLPASASAGWFGNVVSSIKRLPVTLPLALIGTFFWIFGMITSFFADLSAAFLKWILSPGFINVSYTNPANNKIIETGLSITQGLVNMLLVLVLIYIALATILRLAGYETKKLLTTFIIIALLVNFAPVICGLIVDASNITMNFFLQSLKSKTGEINIGSSLFRRVKGTWDGMGNLWEGVFSGEKGITITATRVTEVAVLAVIYLFTSLIYGLFACVFIARYIVIWLLVILSPIAFACYILPATKRFWSLWWNQFIQWSFVGVTCLFFLYLAELLATSLFQKNPSIVLGAAPGTELTIGASILPYFIPLAFLAIGLIYGLQTAVMGASAMISVTTRGWKRGGKAISGKAWRVLKLRVAERTPVRKATRGLIRGVQKVPVLRWGIPEPLRKFSETRPAIEKASK